MPEHYDQHGGDRPARLFAMRLARRRGEMDAEDPELAAYGESMGVPRADTVRTGGQAMPAGPQAATAPTGGYKPFGLGMFENAIRNNEVATLGSVQTPRETNIPALDELANKPRRKSRGLMHSRQYGRVM